MPTSLQSNFNGEWSPLMLGRVELQRYSTALRTMVNFMPTYQGGARKRPGMEYLGEVADSSNRTRIHSFTFSNEQSYLLEFGDQIVRFWKNGVLLVDTEVTPYAGDEVFEIRLTSANDLIYIAHKNHWPQVLSRDDSENWTISDLDTEFLEQPFGTENQTDITLQASALTGNIQLTASEAFFESDMVGSQFWIGHIKDREESTSSITSTIYGFKTWDRNTDFFIGDIVENGATDEFYYVHTDYPSGTAGPNEDPSDYPQYFDTGVVAAVSNAVGAEELDYYVGGEWSVTTQGTWTGTWGIQISYNDGATWSTIYTLSSSGDANFIREGDQTGDIARIRIILFSGVTNSSLITFTRNEIRELGVVDITAVNTDTTANATVLRDLLSTEATLLWAENEWNLRKGYPSQVFFKNNRLCFAATKAEGQAIWGSEVDRWSNFLRTNINIEDTDPFKDVLLTGNQDPIRWVSEQSKTLLGLSSQIRDLTREDTTNVLAPGKNDSSRQAGRGASNVDAVEVDDFTFYAQAGGRIIRGLSNDYERGVFAAPDMTREADHITDGGVIQMDFQLNRVSTLYVVTGSGEVACLIFDPEIQKMGWYRLVSDNGEIESVAILPTTGEEDEVYFVVKRVIDGQTKRYVERLKNDQVRIQDQGDKNNMFYVDSGKVVEGSGLTQITDAGHLEGEVIQVMGDGAYLGERTVVSGTFDFPESDRVTYGKKITANLWQMPLEGITAGGTTSGGQKRVKEVTIDLFNSLGLYVKESPDDTKEPFDITPRRNDDDLETSESLYSGKNEVRVRMGRSFDGSAYYEANEPFGVFIRNIITKWDPTTQ